MKRLFNQLFLLCILASMISCQSAFGVDEFSLVEHELSSEEQFFSIDVEDIVYCLAANYWVGAVEIWDKQPELVQHGGTLAPNLRDDLFIDGGWFTAQATHEPLKVEVKIDKNEGDSPRHLELYVEVVYRNAAGKIDAREAGTGYHIILHQAAHR